jgi:hypothetical protein
MLFIQDNSRLITTAALASLFILVVWNVAFAATASTTVDLSPAAQFALDLLIALSPVIAVIVSGLVSYALARVGLKQDAQQGDFMRQRLEALLNSGVNLAKSRLQTQYQGHLSVDVHNELLATVSNYVLQHGTAVAKYYEFNSNPLMLAQKAEAWLASQGLVPSAAGVVQVPNAVPVPAGANPIQPRTEIPVSIASTIV